MKNILFITAFPPCRRSGGQTFSLNLLTDLAIKYNIDLIYFTYKDHFVEPVSRLNSIKAFNVKNINCLSHPSMHPVFTRRFNKNILNYLKGIINNYDILFFDHSQVALYSLYINHPNKIIRCHDIIFQKYSRKKLFLKYWIKSTENKIYKSTDNIFVPSKKDADLVKQVYNIDVCYTNEYLKEFTFYKVIEKNNYFVFFGLWSRKENLEGLIWFINKIYPLIDRSLKIKYLIIGSGLMENIQRKYLPSNDFYYLGFVDNPLDVIYTSRALIAPLFAGAGVKVKVIDAFTTGTPVIGTDITFEGLPRVEKLVYLARAPEEYASLINDFPVITYEEKEIYAGKFRSIYDNKHLSDFI